MPDSNGIGHETARLIAKNAAMEAGAEIAEQLRDEIQKGFATLHDRITEAFIEQARHSIKITNVEQDVKRMQDATVVLPVPKDPHAMNPFVLVVVTAALTSFGTFAVQAALRSVAKELPPVQSHESK